MFTEADFWKGRDKQYPDEVTDEMRVAAKDVLRRAEEYVQMYEAATGNTHPRRINSGFRSAAINAATVGAAKRSKHMRCLAIDIDDDEGDLGMWALTEDGIIALKTCGLWAEHPGATKGWHHVQSVPPGNPPRPSVTIFWP